MLCHTVPMLAAHLHGTPVTPQTFGGGGDGWRPTSIGSIDSDVVPVRCHWSRAADEDRCPAILEQAADAWAAQIDRAGFTDPLPDSDGLVDIYLTTEYTKGGAYTDGTWVDEVEGDGRNGCSAYIAIDYHITDEEMPGYVVHEFNHVLQYAYDFWEPTYMIWESVASAAEEWTYPDVGVYTDYVIDFQRDPWMGLLGDGYFMADEYLIFSYYEYGGSIWALHLDEEWGDGIGGGGAALWEAASNEGWTNEPDVMDAYDTVSGDWQQALLEFSAARARMGGPNAPSWADWEGSGFHIGTEADLTAGDLPTTVVPEIGPYQTGVTYVSVSGVPSGKAVAWSVSTTSAASADLRWGSVAVQGATEQLSSTGSGSFDADGSSGEIIVGVVNMGPPDFDGDDSLEMAEIEVEVSMVDATGGGDGGSTDGGAADGGSSDGGSSDGGSGDGGSSDGGSSDGGAGDGGTTGDAGASDGGADAGAGDGGADEGKGGCSAIGSAGMGVWLFGAGLVGMRRRRRD